LTGWNYFSHFRRMLGLYAFFYGLLHLTTYLAFDRGFNLLSVASDTAKRPFILAGMTALFLMIPLAVTSTNGAIKRMGAARWKRLHSLVYPAAIAAVLHYYLLVKADVRLPIAFAISLGFLLAYRAVANRLATVRRKPSPVSAP
jgi:sulfoxide reductase heme-binding subunit YedZ